MNIQSFLKGWKPFEIFYLITGFTALTVTTLVFNGSLIQYICSLCLIMNAILLARGKVESHFFSIGYCLTYIYVSYLQKYYGEIILSMSVYLPVSIYALVNWLGHLRPQDHTVTIQKLTAKEIIVAFALQIPLSFLYYLLLRYFGTDNIILGVLSIVFSVLASYFEARISILGLYCFIGNDICIILMWLLPVLEGQTNLVSVLVGPLMIIMSDIYGVINWRKMTRQQNSPQ